MVNSQPPEIIYEDEWLLVINKPAGMVVNRAETVGGETLQDWLEKNFQFSIFNFQNLRSGIVHRLDKETSGVMVVAKTRQVFEALQRQFRDRLVTKTYMALVYGKLVPREGNMAVPIGRSKQNREKFGVMAGGRPAETGYRVKEYYDGYTLVELWPKTGRTHQLRVHLSYLGHPIVGDERYAGEKQRRAGRKVWQRQWLHAAKLSLEHPQTGKRMTWEARLPSELNLAKMEE